MSAASDGLAAVDDEGVSDGEGCLIGAQPQHGVGDLLGLSHPSDGFLVKYGLASFGGVLRRSG
jgi:hypothetical protein